ncbi:MAG: lipoprotein-anchoring transpeptidase ErfK/SrfK [Arenicella sp.]|jgi:lipoprotein-anchoring transpeptidase ErfK/SrfK
MAIIKRLNVSVAEQMMRAYSATDQIVFEAQVSTAKNGIGQRNGSECTPLGEHRIRAKIGAGQVENTVFIARRPSSEVYTQALSIQYPSRDWILSRILWLCGNQLAFNRGGQVDTQRRYIYIHGAPDSHPMGVPSSHGCIKMRNSDIIQLFEQVAVGTIVNINQ